MKQKFILKNMTKSIRKPTSAFLAILSISFVLVCFAFSTPANATQTIPYKMNFQGRLTDNAGTPKTDGTYNMKFRIYDASSGGTLVWSEERSVYGTSGVELVGGLFSTQLGDVVALDPADFTDPDLYFEIELPTPATATCATNACAVYSEGAMGPRNKLGSSAYAFNADTVDGIDGANLGQLNGSNVWTGTNQVVLTSTTAFQIQKAAGSDTIMTADTTNNRLVVGNSTSAANADVTLFVVDGSTDTYTPTGVAGGMYYDTTNNKFKCYTTGWVDCDTTGGGGGTQRVYLSPEFAGGTLNADSSDNNGLMLSEYDASNDHNYYNWDSSQTALQDYSIVVRTKVPSDYASGFGAFKVWLYGESNSTVDNDIQVEIKDTGTACSSLTSYLPGTAAAWTQQTITTSGCTGIAANDIITIHIKVFSKLNNAVRVGAVQYEYTN